MADSSATAQSARQFEMTEEDFADICELVRDHTGIALSDGKRELVYGRLGRRLRKLRIGSFAEYRALLHSGELQEIEHFVNAITTNLTSFFREQHHFEHLKHEVLPALLESNAATRRIRIWSAGCSSGEEAYSVAMILQECAASLQGWDVRVLATDLDSEVLQVAQAGVYAHERLAKIDEERRQRWFQDVPGDPERLRVAPEVAELVTFRNLNLMGGWPMRGPFDVIFCRNVVIYFDKETQRELFARMAPLQPVGAHLYIGHSETLYRISDRYELIGKTTWRRVSP